MNNFNEKILYKTEKIYERNNIVDAKEVLDKYQSIDIIEIDVLYDNGRFIASHDYFDDTRKSLLSDWIDLCMKYDKKIWLDIKDSFSSEIHSIFSLFNIEEFEILLLELYEKYKKINKNLKEYLLISTQFKILPKIYRLCKKHNFIFVYDQPQIKNYLFREIVPKSFIQKQIWNKIKDYNGMVAIDIIFFDNIDEVGDFVKRIKSNKIILYNVQNFKEQSLKNVNKDIVICDNFY
jgi:hypothetical protein